MNGELVCFWRNATLDGDACEDEGLDEGDGAAVDGIREEESLFR